MQCWCAPALPPTLIFSDKKVSNAAISMIRSPTGLEQSTVKARCFFFPLGAAFFVKGAIAADKFDNEESDLHWAVSHLPKRAHIEATLFTKRTHGCAPHKHPANCPGPSQEP